jgi:hypothetical protein
VASKSPPIEPWTGCVEPCTDEEIGEAQTYGRCAAHFSPAEATVEAGGHGHDDVHSLVAGPPGGATDVVSLGCGGSIVIDLGLDGAYNSDSGPDFVVFENPFSVDFPEPAEVWVSADGCEWLKFDCAADGDLDGCAGRTPTEAVWDEEPEGWGALSAGGDTFDLEAVGVDWIRFVRLIDRSESYWSARDGDWCDPGMGGKGGFDLDAIAVVNPNL